MNKTESLTDRDMAEIEIKCRNATKTHRGDTEVETLAYFQMTWFSKKEFLIRSNGVIETVARYKTVWWQQHTLSVHVDLRNPWMVRWSMGQHDVSVSLGISEASATEYA